MGQGKECLPAAFDSLRSLMFGKNIHVVRCVREIEGRPCRGMIEIPQGDKGVCPQCGAVVALADHYALKSKIQHKAVQPLGMKTGLG